MLHKLVIRCFFFFQAEDGIRDLVRSRGLGDVYKRQPGGLSPVDADRDDGGVMPLGIERAQDAGIVGTGAVSYTHLTLPTSDLV